MHAYCKYVFSGGPHGRLAFVTKCVYPLKIKSIIIIIIIIIILDLDNFQVRLQYWVASLCNQLLPEFSSNQFETLHRCYKHIEDVHVTFSRQENHFLQNCGILDLDNFKVRFQ